MPFDDNMLILNSIDVKKAIKCVAGLRLTDVLKTNASKTHTIVSLCILKT